MQTFLELYEEEEEGDRTTTSTPKVYSPTNAILEIFRPLGYAQQPQTR